MMVMHAAPRRAESSREQSKRSPNPADRYVGNRIRMRRLMLGLSQTALANELGLTFQQVQKYEKGANRVAGSRLQQISEVLQVPISFFFEELPHSSSQLSLADVSGFLATSNGLSLAEAFMAITKPKLRRGVVELVEKIAERFK